MNGKASLLVVGGGISGLTAAVEASEAGAEVTLAERNPYLGGRVAQMHQYFPKLCPPSCGLEILLRRVRSNPRIKCLTQTEVQSLSGEPGRYRAALRRSPRFVNARCTLCGACAPVCPESRPDEFNCGLGRTPAVYLPFETAYPARFAIDGKACKGPSCGLCVKACPYGAIELDMKPETIQVEAGGVVWAAGWDPYDASKLKELGFGASPNVITNLMMERLAAANGPTGGQIKRPSDGKPPASVAFVQCAGSRDENHLRHCSGVCCMGSLKQARYVRAQNPEARVFIYYIDLRAPGRLEDFLAETQKDAKTTLVKGKAARVTPDPSTGDLEVEAEDVLSGRRVRERVQLVVLATGLVAAGNGIPGLRKDECGFWTAEAGARGPQPAGCARRPADVSACVQDAAGAAMKALSGCSG